MMYLLLVLGCSRDSASLPRVEPTFVTVEVSGELGSEEAPLPFSTSTQSWTVTASALDLEGDPYDFDGDLRIRVRPGDLDMDPWVTLTDGVWTGEVSFHAGFGPTRVWFGDEGDKDASSTREPSWATGVSEAIWFERPTIAEMQASADVETNNLEGEFAEIRVEDRHVVVTAMATTGFWVTDTDDAPGSYNSLFVYTFNEPRDVAVGDHIVQLNGGDNEYLGATQISWPTWTSAEGVTLDLPDPVVLTNTSACDDATMEGLEAALVEVPDATIPSSFVPGSEDYETWQEYGQWPVTFGDGSCTVYVSAATVAPDFSPDQHVGENLGVLRGMLTQIWDAWIVLPRSADDIGASAARPAAPTRARSSARPSLPLPRPAPGAAHAPLPSRGSL